MPWRYVKAGESKDWQNHVMDHYVNLQQPARVDEARRSERNKHHSQALAASLIREKGMGYASSTVSKEYGCKHLILCLPAIISLCVAAMLSP